MGVKKLTILFTPLDGWGHINACHGLAQELQSRGHRIVFAVDRAFNNKLTPFGFEEELHGIPSSEGDKEYWPLFMEKYCHILLEGPLDIAQKFFLAAAEKMFADNKERDVQYQEIIDKVKPDVIISDNYICSPVLTNQPGIPWVWLFSAAPHQALDDERIPPAWSGMPVNGDRKEWQTFADKLFELKKPLQKQISDYCVSKGAPPLQGRRFHPESPHLNIYLWPKELDYDELKPMPNNWVGVENFIRIVNETFEIPAPFGKKPGKLVFLSMGSFGCANMDLMKRVTRILAKSQHKFIVSKGPVFDSQVLPENMWGERFLPQTAVLPLVDLVITHGGNNTVTESFYFGKPMLVLPLFGDQYDNGQRIQEKGLGLRLNPFHCSEDELIKAVDRLATDEGLAQRMKAIGERIRKSNDKQLVSDKIESIFK